jgi:hypothetical protein
MADKKISELPLITTISGSIVFVPIVHDGITEKITVEDFSKFTNKYAAQTGSVNIFTANQTITANLSVGGTSTLTGNTSIGGNLVVNGKLTAQELFTEITSASIIFESGSTIFGNSADDTHQFTGIVSINGTTIGAQALNDFTASTNNQLQRVYQTTSSLNIQTGSQDLVNLRISSTTGSINTTTSSFDSVFLRISSTTGSINTTTSSFDSVFLRISSTTGSINTTTSSFNSEFIKIGSTTSSIHFTTQSLNTQTGSQDNLNAQIGIATGSLNAFTGSVIGQTNTISTFTASVNFTTQSLNTQTGSQNTINFNISVVTSSIDAHILKQSIQTGSQDLINYNLSVVTSSINAHILKQATQTGSQDLVNYNISVVTSSIDAHILKQATQTGSQDLVNYQNSIITSSYRIELNSIEAYTSSLKSAIIVNGTNVQIVGNLDVARLNVQYVSSSVLVTSGSNVFGDASNDKHEFTGSVNIKDALYVNNTLFVNGQAVGLGELNAFSGSQIGKDFTLSVVTSSIDAHILKQATQTGSQDLVNYNISVVTASLNTQTGSQNTINFNISVITASIDSHILKQATQTGSQDLVNYNISIVTSSIDSHILKQATQTGSQDLVNLGISTFTGSLRSEVNLIEAYTASLTLKTGSYATTGSNTFIGANTFTGSMTLTGSFNISGSITMTGNTLPSITNTYTLGNGSFRYSQVFVAGTVYVGNGTIKGNSLGFGDEINNIYMKIGSTATGGNIGMYGIGAPYVDNGSRLQILASGSQNALYVSGSSQFTGSLNVSGSTNLTGSVTINESRIDTAWTSYTPTWTAASADPAIVNGTITAAYKVIGKTCFVRVRFQMGSSTTYGTGAWYIGLPIPAVNAYAVQFPASLLNNGTAWFSGIVNGGRLGNVSKAEIQVQNVSGTADGISPTFPFTWGDTDEFSFNGSYEIA